MRLLVVSDIHGNVEALRAVLAAEPAADRVIFLGDVVDYGPAPAAAVRWIAERAWAAVRGNHDNAVGLGVGCRSAPLYRRLSEETRRLTVPMLSGRDLAWLRALPATVRLEADGVRLALLHAAPGDPLFRYLPAGEIGEWTRAAAAMDADLLLVGHTHIPALFDAGGTRVLNPGSVGLQRDGDPRASYAVIEDGRPVLKRVAYDVEATVAALRAWGLPADVADTMERIYRTGKPPA